MSAVNKKILILATYPIEDPKHGGQKRVDAIVTAYRKKFKEVRFAAVFYRGFYLSYGKDDIYVSGKTKSEIEASPYTGDVICGEAIYGDQKVRSRIAKLLTSFKPDIIQIEQTFPYLGLRPLLRELGMQPTLVLSSHNIEYLMKEEILESIGASPEVIGLTVDKIREAEERLTQEADLVIAVSEQDRAVHEKMGAKRTVLATNGISKVEASEDSKRYWRGYMEERAVRKAITFVGSAHPPNWVGFLSMVGEKLGFVPLDARIFLAGSISEYFEQNIKDETSAHMTFWNRAVACGRLSDDRLAGLIDQSDVLILPIVEGGGSNLKTAEAILSGKKIVGTTYAFRAFEDYMSLPNIYVADEPKAFREQILHALNSEYVARSAAEEKLAEKVQWKYCLSKAVESVTKL